MSIKKMVYVKPANSHSLQY